MTDIWLPGFERIEIANRPGGAYDRTDRWKLCLHTTEGSTIRGAIAAYLAKGVPPHFTLDRNTREKVQHIPLNRRSYSLRNSEAEDEPVIQIELVGFAQDSADWTDDDIAWLASIGAEIREHCPFDLAYPPQGFGGSEGYGRNGKYRMAMSDWVAFSGIVGHCHSPSPDTHWDPGDFRIDTLLVAIDQADRNDRPILIEDQEPFMATPQLEVPAAIDAIDKMYERYARNRPENVRYPESPEALEWQIGRYFDADDPAVFLIALANELWNEPAK